MGNYKDRMTLLKTLCTQHPALRHGQLIPPAGARKSFYKNMDDLTASNINYGQMPAVVMGEFSARPSNGEWHRTRLSNEWFFLDKPIVSSSDPSFTAAKELVYDAMEKVMMDFIQLIKVDYEDEQGCGLFKFLDLGSFRWERTGPYGDNLFGWVLRFNDEITPDPQLDIVPNNYWLDIEGEVEQSYELIAFEYKSSIAIDYNYARRSKFGQLPGIEVWVVAGNLNYQVWADFVMTPIPNPTTITVKIAGPASGYVKLRA